MSEVIPYALLYELENYDTTTCMGISWIEKPINGMSQSGRPPKVLLTNPQIVIVGSISL